MIRVNTGIQLTGEICADAPRALCYSSTDAAGSDKSSQDSRGEHVGLFLKSIVFLNLFGLSKGDFIIRCSRGVHIFIVTAGRQGRNARFPCQANETKRDLIRDELCSAMVMRGSTK